MSLTILVLAGLAVLASAIALRTWWSMRGTRLVTCPENQETVAVELQAARAAVTGVGRHPTLRLRDCTRWPEKEGCGQDCLREIEAAPMECLVRRILETWYADKSCALCGKDLRHLDWKERAPALMSGDGITLGWEELVPEKIPETLRTHAAVCFDCHISSTFRRRYRHLVVDRPWDTARLGGKH